MAAFQVLPYTIDNLVQCFANGSKFISQDAVRAKKHRVYFEEYFQALGAATIVVECNYVDRDYLEDYAAYYDRCFQDYPRRTQRLHFFREAFDEAGFQSVLDGSAQQHLTEERLRASYLGFVVVKPLPATIVGRTCLVAYPADNGRRNFPILRTYAVHLFGIVLEVESLAYQEQDSVVAACATSALWSCFQGTGKLFQHMIPPPVEITNWAGDHMPENLLAASARAFPNNGLTATQMAYAVRRVGLEPSVVGAQTRYGLNSVAYAYLQGRLPMLLACQFFENLTTAQPSPVGGHAIALTGFSLGDPVATPQGPTGFLLRASRIDKLYGHDDQVGPFARMTWEQVPNAPHFVYPHPMAGAGGYILRTSWGPDIGTVADFVLLPLYHKIRIPYDLIHAAILNLDAIVEGIRRAVFLTVPRAEWDIYLTTGSEYKESVRAEYPAMGVDQLPSLLAELPRFVWRARARVNDRVQLDFLFDATGITQHDLLLHVVSTGSEYAQMIGALAPQVVANKATVSPQVVSIFERFLVSPIQVQQPGP
ncbi:hypothetical protein [Burkholderia sp. SRS-25]|uniref:hypothetical protein n=1 Tax=Burkholderia sp. SRS-25 TaxID=2094190 RepID=UPI001050EB2E|nr:hypothetical protein [Burkholderia sp. SRS-25]TCW72854.1 hypothetical protein C5O79_02640 [Burkholderia sp. SRS-25]